MHEIEIDMNSAKDEPINDVSIVTMRDGGSCQININGKPFAWLNGGIHEGDKRDQCIFKGHVSYSNRVPIAREEVSYYHRRLTTAIDRGFQGLHDKRNAERFKPALEKLITGYDQVYR